MQQVLNGIASIVSHFFCCQKIFLQDYNKKETFREAEITNSLDCCAPRKFFFYTNFVDYLTSIPPSRSSLKAF